MAKIAIDIDSTLYDFPSLCCRVMGELAEAHMRSDDPLSLIQASRLRNAAYSTTWSEWRTPIDLAGEKAFSEAVDICHEPDNILTQEPYPGAVTEVWALWNAGHEIVYVSNRNSLTKEPTAIWLDERGFPLSEEACCSLLCHTDDKLASVRDCAYLIDDRPRTLVGFVYGAMDVPADAELGMDAFTALGPRATGRKAFGLAHPYNRNLTDVPNIYLAPNWPLLGAYLREKIPSEAVR